MTRLSRRDEALLVQLADGALSGPALERARARVNAIPDGEALLGRQRRVAGALGGAVERRAPAPRPAWRLVPAGALAAACVLLTVLFAFQGGGTAVEQAADVAQLPATDGAPSSSGEMLDVQVDGVRFPDWGREFGWHATGMRRDELAGRRAATVFYEHEGHRLAYTILAGPAVPRPDGARVVRRNGAELALYRDPSHGGHDIAVFERGGRTCVVAGHVLEVETLIKLAASDA